MYWFGQNVDPTLPLSGMNWEELREKRQALAETKIERILDLLDAFSREWKEESEAFQEALPELVKETAFSSEETRKTLALLSPLLKRGSLEARIKAEFGKGEVLDGFTKLPHQRAKVRAVPNGPLLHVTAGNVFLSSIDSLIMGFLTKNLSLLKVSRQNKFFPLFFAEKLRAFDREKILSDKFAILYWKGGDWETEDFIKSKVRTIIAWGGEEMVNSYRKDLPLQTKLLDFGPKISLQVITSGGLKDRDLKRVAESVVSDIIPWNQLACASPQNLYLQEGIDPHPLMEAIHTAFLSACPRGELHDDEATEVLKEKYRGLYSELMGGGSFLEGPEHLIHLEEERLLRPSPLHRSLIVKRFKDGDELFRLLEPFSYYLQSCSYLFGEGEREALLNSLALTGIKRFAPLGTITRGMEGAPHDGRFVLRELVHFIGDERRVMEYDEEILQIENAATLKSHFEKTPHPKGYLFSSGGTTGEPKFVHYSYEEFDFMSDMLAENLLAQGVRPGMTVANLFVAGNLWSSFMCVEKALEKIGAVQLPIGGMCSSENTLLYLSKFGPDVVMGIPSLLVLNAEFMERQGVKIKVPLVFYAGESLSEARREYLQKTWGTEVFGSAGYASVDAGVMGYQCKFSGTGEHHVFSDFVDLRIIEDEAVVTSVARDSMPIKNYRTGDRIEWLEGECPCGRPDRRFKLLGRIDSVIQIWSCRIQVSDVEKVLQERDILTFQLSIHERREANLIREKLVLSYEKLKEEMDQEALLLSLYENSRDVRDTVTFEDFKRNVELKPLPTGQIPRNPRTGKISLILDHRK